MIGGATVRNILLVFTRLELNDSIRKQNQKTHVTIQKQSAIVFEILSSV
jgi:hypothetical protein